MQLDRFLFMPKVSLKPDRVVLFNEVLIRNYENNTLDSIHKGYTKSDLGTDKEKNSVSKAFHNFNISHSAQKRYKKK